MSAPEVSELPESEEKLARLLASALRDLPPCPAPATLESRVLGELQRRAALPWWRRSIAHWPAAARAAFYLAGGGLAWLAVLAGTWPGLNDRLPHDLSALMPWLERATALTGIAGSLAASLARVLPTAWLVPALAFGALLYGLLFALGIAAYRILYLDSATSGDSRT